MKPYLLTFIAITLVAATAGFGASREIVVYSFLTDAGRNLVLPAPERPARCALGIGGYHEWGGIRAGEKPTKPAQIEPLVRAALGINSYAGLRVGESPDLVIEFHWGCLRPDASGLSGGRHDVVVNQLDMLDLVGGRVLENNHGRILRSALIEAAAEERYFLIVSAFEPIAYARDRKLLLWRTQISVPIPGITQEQAWPILAATGATHFGRETAEPRFISVDIEATLRAALQRIAR
jgi:hypothetical protein